METYPCPADQALHQVKLMTNIIDYIQQEGLRATNTEQEGKTTGLTARQCCFLTAVQCITAKLGGPVSIGFLARDLHMSASSVSHLVDTLVENNLLERNAHTDDRRSVLITLSPTGLQYAIASRRGMLEAIQRLTSELTPEENAMRLQMIDKLYRKAYPTAP